jgi:hypothetical protein
MKNRIAIIKQQVGNEGKKTLFVVIGFASGALISKGLDKLGESMPKVAPFVKYAKPIVLGGGGLLISAATTKEEESIKHFGYGLSVSGAFEGLRLIPVVKDFLSLNGLTGLDGTELDNPQKYFTENSLSNLELGNFGINALPVKNFDVEDIQSQALNLPDLNGADTSTSIGDIGFNISATDDVDLKGIL